MNPFDHMIRQVMRGKLVGSVRARPITTEEYQLFCKEYMFDNLKDVSFGQSFCKRFDITDYVLEVVKSEKSAKRHIETVGYVNDPPPG